MCKINYDETAYSMIENIFGDYREIVGKASDEIQKIARKIRNFFKIFQKNRTVHKIYTSVSIGLVDCCVYALLYKYCIYLYTAFAQLVSVAYLLFTPAIVLPL